MLILNDSRRMLAAVLAATLALAGCASDIMGGFVGKDITQVVAQYGPPANVFDAPDGKRAFQWQRSRAIIMPTTTTVTGYGYGNMATIHGTTSGGYMGNQSCYYTLYAQPTPKGGWTVVGFEPPNMMCE